MFPAFVDVVGLGPVVARARVLVHEVLDRGAQAVARGGAHCASLVLDRGVQVVAVAATLSQQEKSNSPDVQRKRANFTHMKH